MRVASHFSTDHKEFIQDVAYDYYGRRLATASIDHSIKIWEQRGEKWECVDTFKTHNGPVFKLAWAHPEFGQVLASCSSDRSVHIHEELADGVSKPKWHKKGALNDSTSPVHDIAFSPRHHGLKLATISEDGRVRIHESSDVLNLANWTLHADFEVGPPAAGTGCLSWNQSTFDDPMLVVGYGKDVGLWQYGAKVMQWQKIAALEPHEDMVRDVAWAPQMGRQYHLIATACKDKGVRIFQVKYNHKANKFDVELSFDKAHQVHEAEVWRVAWNVTGTVLASTGDDGKAKLWECDSKGNWKCSVALSGIASMHQDGSRRATLVETV